MNNKTPILFPDTLENLLGFDKIRLQLSHLCVSEMGKEYVIKMRFRAEKTVLDLLHGQTKEMLKIFEAQSAFPVRDYLDIRSSLKKATIEGTMLTLSEWADIKIVLNISNTVQQFFHNDNRLLYPTLASIFNSEATPPSLLSKINSVIDDKGQIVDTASPALYEIRKSINKLRQQLYKKVDVLVKRFQLEGWMTDAQQPTIREGRIVFPVPSENKRKLIGLVVDASGTGSTVYIEPSELLEFQNEIKTYSLAEEREISKILTELTDQLRPYCGQLLEIQRQLGIMDFIHARAKLAQQQNAYIPQYSGETFVKWIDARHPLLEAHLVSVGKKIQPLSFFLSEERRILVISGPNAGGKSMALKTLGLLQYMFQCGLAVPVHPDSKFGIFKNICLDIGDKQSLEDDLSTYSSHLLAMKYFLKYANKETLVLIDEMGSGTAPEMGGAIAEAILERLAAKGAWGAISTHYDNLKLRADACSGLINASMRYDAENLKPCYQLDIGVPGSSFALEIAKQIGLPDEVVTVAKNTIGKEKISVEDTLLQLQKEKTNYEQKNRELLSKLSHYERENKFFEELKASLKQRQNEILKKAKEEAAQLIKDANKKIEYTIRSIKESQADKSKTKILREDLEQTLSSLKTEEEPITSNPTREAENEAIPTAIRTGTFVKLRDKGTYAKVESIVGESAEISIGQIKSRVKLNRLLPVSKREYYEATGLNSKSRINSLDLIKKMEEFSHRIDVRGMRGEEVFNKVHTVMDQALLLSQYEIAFVHGKGDGVLRKIIRDQLKVYKEVKSIEDEHADRGGDGVTIVKLR